MAYNYRDALKALGLSEENPVQNEVFSSVTKVRAYTGRDQAIELFPELADVANPNVIYAPVELCRSLPFINDRRRCFTAETLERSVVGIKDNLVNFDHEVADNFEVNGFRGRDRVCGHLKSAVLGPEDNENHWRTAFALTVLYGRQKEVREMANEHVTGKAPWFVSMECGHDITQSDFWYDNSFIPFKEADSGMLRCVKTTHIDPYKGKDLALVVGGKDGSANFWGMAFTKTPADSNSRILNMYTAAAKRETASSGSSKTVFLPLRIEEEASAAKDIKQFNTVMSERHPNMLATVASIEVIGQTTEADDGHVHDVLSDGTIMPVSGHGHYISAFSVVPGSRPKFQATLSDYTRYDEAGNLMSMHVHRVDVELRPKQSSSEISSSQNDGESVMGKKIDKLTNLFSEFRAELAGTGQQGAGDGQQGPAVRALLSLDVDKSIADAAEEIVEERVEAGELVNKDDHEEAITKTKEETTTEINLEHEREKRKDQRIASIAEAGLELDTVIRGEGEDAVTIGKLVESFPLDDAGEDLFQNSLAMWKTLKPADAEGQHAEAASSGKGKKVTAAAGGGPPKKKEVASSGTPSKKKLGRHAVS